MLVIRYEYVILTFAFWPLANAFVQASGGMSAIAEVLVLIPNRLRFWIFADRELSLQTS